MKSVFFSRLLLAAVLLFGLNFTAAAQSGKPKSPPVETSHTIGDLTIGINYNAPSVRGRKIWGSLVPNGKVWRTGANGATTFTVSKDVMIDGKKLAAGTYALFTIPTDGDWTFIFNTEANQWGAYNYDSSKDALRITTKTGKAPEFVEQMTFNVGDNDENVGVVSFTWENLKTNFNVTAAK
ncbi:MAG: DUF2911 domain-containing protein [Bacteroidota bacterium]